MNNDLKHYLIKKLLTEELSESIGPYKALLTEKEAAMYLNISVSWLRKARIYGRTDAPPFVKVGRAVRYSLEALDTYLETRVRFNTLYINR